MLPTLEDRARDACARWSILLCSIALVPLPLTAEWSDAAQAGATAPSAVIGPLPQDPLVGPAPAFRPVRDPFVALVASAPDGTGAAVGGRVRQGDHLGIVLPPNAGAAVDAVPGLPAAGTPVVKAVIVGKPSRALIADGVTVRVFGVGDLLAGVRIREITSRTVVLQNGVTLPITGESP